MSDYTLSLQINGDTYAIRDPQGVIVPGSYNLTEDQANAFLNIANVESSPPPVDERSRDAAESFAQGVTAEAKTQSLANPTSTPSSGSVVVQSKVFLSAHGDVPLVRIEQPLPDDFPIGSVRITIEPLSTSMGGADQ